MTSDALSGFGVVVTRPPSRADELVSAIEAAGGQAIRFSVIDIVGRDISEVASEFANQPQPDIAVFISRNAVEFGHSVLAGSTAKIAAIGPATAAALAAAAISADIVPGVGFDSEHLLAHPALQDIDGKSITIVRGNGGREFLARSLQSRGATVSYLAVYERKLHIASVNELGTLENAWNSGSVNCITIMSVESLQNFLQLMPTSCLEYLPETLLVAPSERVIQTARDLIPGIPTALAPGPQVADMVKTLIAHKQSGQN